MDIDAPISATLTHQSCTLTDPCITFSQDMTHPWRTIPGGRRMRHTIDKCITGHCNAGTAHNYFMGIYALTNLRRCKHLQEKGQLSAYSEIDLGRGPRKYHAQCAHSFFIWQRAIYLFSKHTSFFVISLSLNNYFITFRVAYEENS